MKTSWTCLNTKEMLHRICKLLRSIEIDSEKSILPDWDLIPGVLKGLQIRAQDCDETLRLNASKLV